MVYYLIILLMELNCKKIMLFIMMLTHGVAPQSLFLSTLVPIPKIREEINVTLIILNTFQ